jgi:hypothetical protein
MISSFLVSSSSFSLAPQPDSGCCGVHPTAFQPFEARISSKYLQIQFLPRRKYNMSILQTNWLMLLTERILVYSENRT